MAGRSEAVTPKLGPEAIAFSCLLASVRWVLECQKKSQPLEIPLERLSAALKLWDECKGQLNPLG